MVKCRTSKSKSETKTERHEKQQQAETRKTKSMNISQQHTKTANNKTKYQTTSTTLQLQSTMNSTMKTVVCVIRCCSSYCVLILVSLNADFRLGHLWRNGHVSRAACDKSIYESVIVTWSIVSDVTQQQQSAPPAAPPVVVAAAETACLPVCS